MSCAVLLVALILADVSGAFAKDVPAPLNLPTDVAKSRRRLAADPHRPLYHFLPPANFLKDPNGLLYWKGRYHLFYQSNPLDMTDLNMTWSHAVSEDLVHWTDLPVAFAPTPKGPDYAGCFSGNVVVVDGVPTAVYYGNDKGICLARAHPEDEFLIHWEKYAGNPIVPHPPAGSGWKPFDPNVFRDGDTWVMLCGGRVETGDTAYTLVSKDFLNWKFLHNFYESSRKWTKMYDDCAVPDFFKLRDRYALVFSSHSGQTQYYLGSYSSKDKKFTPEDHGRFSKDRPLKLDHGDPQAPMTLLAPDGRRVLFNWMCEGRSWETQQALGWGGILWLPRVISLDDNGKLLIEPVEELKKLRGKRITLGRKRVPRGVDMLLQLTGTALEIEAEIDPLASTGCGFRVRSSLNGEESTSIVYRQLKKELAIDVSKSSLDPTVVDKEEQSGPLTLAKGETLKLRIYLDQSVVEVFANGRQCLAKRIYPSREDSHHFRFFTIEGSAELRSFTAWEMKPVWPRTTE